MQKSWFYCWLLCYVPLLWAEEPLPHAQPVPQMQVLPLPRQEASFTFEGRELTRYLFDPAAKRTFCYPVVGPSGRSLTRMGHPRDPQGHSHHHSVWIAHHSVEGVDFWGDQGVGRIVQQKLVRFEDGHDEALAQMELVWQGEKQQPLLKEIRTMRVRPAANKQWWLLLDIELQPAGAESVTLGATPFGFLGVRMAKTIGVHDGGGLIRNSAGQRNEAEVFRQPAQWVDYSGPIAPGVHEGITLMDHPTNFSHPTPFHVRDDGWMGVSPTLAAPKIIAPSEPLTLRYALYIHSGVPDIAILQAEFDTFAKTKGAESPVKK